jgi:two-component system KDP operon response regulator KdpE
MRRILIVDDASRTTRGLDIALKSCGYAVATVPDATTALRLASCNPPDAVVLDLDLPDSQGLDAILGLRGWTCLPIIVLSARTDPADKIAALDAGADDYLTKPFLTEELAARLRAVLRRLPTTEEPGTVDIADWRVNLAAYTAVPASGKGEALHLTPTEWRLLTPLLRNPGRLVPGRQLLRDVWGPQREKQTNYLRVYIAGLRRKLEPDPAHPRHLITEPGIGYRFEP